MHPSSHCPLFFTPPSFSHLKHKFTSVQFSPLSLLPTASFIFTAAWKCRFCDLVLKTHLVTAKYLGCSCRAASLLSLALGLTGCCSKPVQDAEQQNESNFCIFRFYGQLSVLRQFFTGSSEKEGKRGRPSRRVCSAERLAGDAAGLPPTLFL